MHRIAMNQNKSSCLVRGYVMLAQSGSLGMWEREWGVMFSIMGKPGAVSQGEGGPVQVDDSPGAHSRQKLRFHSFLLDSWQRRAVAVTGLSSNSRGFV